MSVADEYTLPGEESEEPAEKAEAQQSGSTLRQKLEAALATNRALTERTAALEAERRTDRLASLAREAGVTEAVASRYPTDSEATPEKFSAWLEGEKTYAQQLAGTTTQQQSAETPATTQAVNPADQLAAARIQAATDGAQPAVDGLENLLARLQDRSVDWPTLQKEMEAFGFRDQ